ncbi:hypothetical protein NPIL_697071 [Nephila pilipes]|uniref:Uncharacterized protein n=1 Tax=Nephila pilipes TaxID=299642 RepID=A0A8X6QF67_NEPPI|nr:hypothetical protein NPIL_697071 [Nephila pilipes]
MALGQEATYTDDSVWKVLSCNRLHFPRLYICERTSLNARSKSLQNRFVTFGIYDLPFQNKFWMDHATAIDKRIQEVLILTSAYGSLRGGRSR